MRTVGDLIEMLERFERDMPILVAHQPSYPLQEVLMDCLPYSDVFETEDYDEDKAEISKEDEFREAVKSRLGREADDICYLVLGGHPDRGGSPYAPRGVFQ